MKLFEVLPGMAQSDGVIVYRVSSENTHSVYYGYGQGDLKKTFIAGANRNAADRTEAKLVNDAGGVEFLKFEELEIFDSEYEAFMERNNLRAQDPDSISGPSNFPPAMFERAKKENPDLVKKWKLDQNLNLKLARDAMDDPQSVFHYVDIRSLVASNPKIHNELKLDLDRLKYPAFVAKYFS